MLNNVYSFSEVSKRGRAAYTILCLEAALVYFGQNVVEWKSVLEELWAITSSEDIEDWIMRICDLCPGEVLQFELYKEIVAQRDVTKWRYTYTEDYFYKIRKLYVEVKHGIDAISKIFDSIYFVIADDWGEYETPYTPKSLVFIQEAQQTLTDYHIQLPHNENILKLIMNHKDKHYGNPFDGIEMSALSHCR